MADASTTPAKPTSGLPAGAFCKGSSPATRRPRRAASRSQRLVRHPKYGKFVKQRTICYVHDENERIAPGRHGRDRRVAAALEAEAVEAGQDREEGAEPDALEPGRRGRRQRRARQRKPEQNATAETEVTNGARTPRESAGGP